MGLFEFVVEEWICWRRHNTNPEYQVKPILPQVNRPIRFRYSHQINLFSNITKKIITQI